MIDDEVIEKWIGMIGVDIGYNKKKFFFLFLLQYIGIGIVIFIK